MTLLIRFSVLPISIVFHINVLAFGRAWSHAYLRPILLDLHTSQRPVRDNSFRVDGTMSFQYIVQMQTGYTVPAMKTGKFSSLSWSCKVCLRALGCEPILSCPRVKNGSTLLSSIPFSPSIRWMLFEAVVPAKIGPRKTQRSVQKLSAMGKSGEGRAIWFSMIRVFLIQCWFSL